MGAKSTIETGLKWIRFVETDTPQKKTKVWVVEITVNGIALGEVKFWPQWRRYAFFALSNTLYEQDCLREIADFCECQTTAWRATRDALYLCDRCNRPNTKGEPLMVVNAKKSDMGALEYLWRKELCDSCYHLVKEMCERVPGKAAANES